MLYSRPSTIAPFPVEETHQIALWPKNRLIAHSDGLGWHNLYGSLADETPWEAVLGPARHHCVAYCIHQSAVIRRSLDGGQSETAVLQPRQFIITPADVVPTFRVDGRPTMLLVYLHREMMDRVAQEALCIDPGKVRLIPRLACVDPLLEHLALSVLDAVGRRDRESVLYVDNIAAAMALQLLSRHSLRRHPDPAHHDSPSGFRKPLPASGLRRAQAYLDTHLGEDLTLESLAREADMSTHCFLRAFTRHFGTPPHQYLLQRRIERAKELLRASDRSLVDIAIETGFSSQSHLSSAFKRSVGVSPGTYRLPA
jgi:AraC family transcriptional regulator